MADELFGFGASLSALANWETHVTSRNSIPSILPEHGGAPMSLQGSVARRALNGTNRRGGYTLGAWVVNAVEGGHAELNAILLALYGSYTVSSKHLYVSSPDERGHYSPFYCAVDCPFVRQSAGLAIYEVPTAVRFDLVGGVLQSVTASADDTIAAGELLTLVDTTADDVELTLPDPATVQPYVTYSARIDAGSNDLIIKNYGGTPTLATLTGLMQRWDGYSTGTAWVTDKTGL